jgi:rod shape-determining protein MreC
MFLFFTVFESLAVYMIMQSSSFRHSAVMARIDAAKGVVQGRISALRSYFFLESVNDELAEANRNLMSEITRLKELPAVRESEFNDSVPRGFDYIRARVVENTLNRKHNKIILDAGKNQGVVRDMGVISSDGVVGTVDRVHQNFSTVTSLLNPTREINGKIKRTGSYGPLSWSGKDIRHTDMSGVPQHIVLEKGDSVVTSGHSLAFPEGIFIGTVDTFFVDKGATYKIRIRLNNDFRGLYHVYVITNFYKQEFDSIKQISLK